MPVTACCTKPKRPECNGPRSPYGLVMVPPWIGGGMESTKKCRWRVCRHRGYRKADQLRDKDRLLGVCSAVGRAWRTSTPEVGFATLASWSSDPFLGGDSVQEESTAATSWNRCPTRMSGDVGGSGCQLSRAWQRGQYRGSCPVHSQTRSAQIFGAGGSAGGWAVSPSSCRQWASLVSTLRPAKRP